MWGVGVLGEVIRRYRLARGLKQRRLAEMVGTGQSYISEIEKGVRTNLTTDLLERLAVALDVPLTELLQAASSEEPRLGLPLGGLPPFLVELGQRVAPLLTEREWNRVAGYLERVAEERAQEIASSDGDPPDENGTDKHGGGDDAA